MKNTRVPAVPLIVNDPYFSIWSPADALNESHTENWTGAHKKLMGYILVDGQRFIFMGKDEEAEKIEQVGLEIKPTQTNYVFANEKIQLKVSFISRILLEDLQSISEPYTYVVCKVKAKDNQEHQVQITMEAENTICFDGDEPKRIIADQCVTGQNQICWMGKAKQSPLNSSGDLITIDWGYLYLAAPDHSLTTITPKFDEGKQSCQSIEVKFDFEAVLVEQEALSVFAYDDLQSINYFGKSQKAYWACHGRTMFEVIEDAIENYPKHLEECHKLDEEIMKKAYEIGGKEFELICSLSYRQAISAHKLIEDDEGQLVFLSKECSSNGCIGTVDVSYPSIPLFLMYNPELVKGMLRPVFKFADLSVWPYEFAPHDVGRYPYACGQVYGMKQERADRNGLSLKHGEVQPMIFEYPKEKSIYELKYQMPIEECGNMIIMTALVYLFEKDISFIKEHQAVLKQWTDYLVEHGGDPGDQLCTDDFAGHLKHNVNLAAKAIVAIRLFSALMKELGDLQEADHYLKISEEMARRWENDAKIENHTKLTFDQESSWSLKYNVVWDHLLGLGLFSEELFQQEVDYYKEQTNTYGVPLDSRETYTKSDWLVWVATMSNDVEDFKALIKPLHKYLEESPDRVPFSDWYDTKTAKVMNFKNRTVQGALFLPLLKEKLKGMEI